MDTAAAAVLLLLCAWAAGETGPLAWWHWLLVVAVAVPVAVRGRWPLAAAAAMAGSAAALLVSGTIPVYAGAVLCAAAALPLYSVGEAVRRSWSVPALAAGIVTAGALGFWEPGTPLVALPAVAVPWAIGRLVRHRRRLAERLATERAERAVADERLRIARDMHDSVAHHLSMITMKASVARHVVSVRPEEATSALAVIEESGREALVEIRRAVGLLRDGDPGGEDQLRTLIGRVAQTGLAIELVADAFPAEMRPVVHRIVQESLTNVIRHARDATRCTVTITAAPAHLEVRVVDDGVAASLSDGSWHGPAGAAGGVRTGPADGSGHGLRGMRERVAAVGGRLDAGPAAGGGFAVIAHLPDPARSRG